MTIRSLFSQNSTYNASDLRALIDALGPQVIDSNGCVATGLSVAYGSSSLVVAAGLGFATANASTTGNNFAVINSAEVTATNYAGGGTIWAAESSASPRTDVVFLVVGDKALDSIAADATTVYFAYNTTTLPSDKTCIRLGHVVSSNGTNPPTIRDMRRSVITAPMVTGNTPMVIAYRSTAQSIGSAWTAVSFPAADLIDYRTFTVNLSDNYSMHRVSNTPLTAPYSGWYDVGFRVAWEGSEAGATQGLAYSVNDGTEVYMAEGPATATTLSLTQNGTMPVHLDAGDTIQLMARSENNSGSIGNAHFWAKLISYDA